MVERAIKPALYKHKKMPESQPQQSESVELPSSSGDRGAGISCDEYLSQHTDHDSVFELKALNKFN